jgi:hypothetical protein
MVLQPKVLSESIHWHRGIMIMIGALSGAHIPLTVHNILDIPFAG